MILVPMFLSLDRRERGEGDHQPPVSAASEHHSLQGGRFYFLNRADGEFVLER